MVHTTLTRLKWHSKLLLRWASKTVCATTPVVEPTMKVEVTTPEDWMGDVVGDLNRREA